MRSLKVKFLVVFFLLILGYIIVMSFINFLVPLYQNPILLLSPMNLWALVSLSMIFSLWVYALIKMVEMAYDHIKYGPSEDRETKELDKNMKSIDIFMDVAQKEFMKRRISKQTFEDIQRIAGKKMVEIKAKKKEIRGGKPEPDKNEGSKDDGQKESK
jgi:hypothetical protein